MIVMYDQLVDYLPTSRNHLGLLVQQYMVGGSMAGFTVTVDCVAQRSLQYINF